MKNEIQIFKNSQLGKLRINQSESGKIYFCLSDVCQALDLGNARQVKSRLDEKGVISNDTPTNGGVQSMIFIDEPNLYRCIFQSRKKQAEKFQDWVFDEVLPSIRKNGGYIVSNAGDTPELIMARALQIAQATIERNEARINLLSEQVDRQEKTIADAAPKVNYFDATLQSVNTYTTTQIAKELGTTAQILNQRLKNANVLFRQSGTWLLKQPYASMQFSATRTQTFTRSDGSIGSSTYTVWTERGRLFIHQLHNDNYEARTALKSVNTLTTSTAC